jgi:FecR protein
MTTTMKKSRCSAVFGIALAMLFPLRPASAQDQYDDPPGRVARLGYMQGSVSFQPAGETDWVGAVPNRPMSTGDQLWTDQGSRAEVQLGSAVIRLGANTGFSFLSLDDDTVQIQLTSGAINITVRRLGEGDDFEVDTPNQAFTAFQPGHYRVEASPDGNSTIISVRDGEGEADGGGQTFDLRGGQRGTFSGTDQLYADVQPIYRPDEFDNWSSTRDHRYDSSRSAHYLSGEVVGYEDLDDYGDWRDDPNYGHVWYPNRVAAGWAPYHDGHWDWISPWGWTWVDDSAWGYAPFHYGRWVSVGERWGWVAGPVAVQAVYAPALVVFIGGGPGEFGGNVGWFPLGPREVYVPSYRVSQAYMTRVNVSNTTVNNVTITNVYNTTIIHNTTNITNTTYANRTVQGAVMVVPQHAFVSAQPVKEAAVAVNTQQIASAPLNGRVAVAPTRDSVLGAKAATSGHVAAPPAAVASRQVVAKKTPPPPPVPFAKQQQALAAHPGQPLAKNEVQTLRPAVTAATRPMVKTAPPAKPATPNVGHPANQPSPPRPGQPTPAANQPGEARPGQPAPVANQPMNRPGSPPTANDHPASTAPVHPNRPPAATPASPQPNNRPEETRPERYQSEPNRPEPNRRQPNQPDANRPEPNREPAAQPNKSPESDHPETPRSEPAPHPQMPPPSERPQERAPNPEERKPTPPPAAAKPEPKPQTPEEKKQEEERQKREEQKPQSE